MRRLAWWGVPIVMVATAACTFDFDAPFAESGGGGAGSSSDTTSTGPDTTSSAGGATSGQGGDTATSSAASTASAGGAIGVPCGGATCTFEDGEGGCCWDPAGGQAQCFTSPPSNSECRTSAQVGSREALIRCRDASDCGGGEECCASYVLDGTDRVYSVVSCAAACSGSSTPLCDPGAADPCPLSEATCDPAPGLPDDYHGCFF